MLLLIIYELQSFEWSSPKGEAIFLFSAFANASTMGGTSSGAEGKVVADLTCPPNAVCSNIYRSKINLTSPVGSPPEIICNNTQGDIGVSCHSSSARR